MKKFRDTRHTTHTTTMVQYKIETRFSGFCHSTEDSITNFVSINAIPNGRFERVACVGVVDVHGVRASRWRRIKALLRLVYVHCVCTRERHTHHGIYPNVAREANGDQPSAQKAFAVKLCARPSGRINISIACNFWHSPRRRTSCAEWMSVERQTESRTQCAG